jgi:hypothetical protein
MPVDSFIGRGNVPALTLRQRDAGEIGYLLQIAFARLYPSTAFGSLLLLELTILLS